MKYFFSLGIMIILGTYYSSGQDGQLVMKHKTHDREKVVDEGIRLKITTEEQILAGKFGIVNDSVISIDGDTVMLSEIEKIRYKSRGSKITGYTVTGFGSLILATGIYYIAETLGVGEWGTPLAIVIGIPITALGVIITASGILVSAIGKKYRDKSWDYSIVIVHPEQLTVNPGK